MKRMSILFVVAVLVCAFASRANAQGTVTVSSIGAGCSSGTIVGTGGATPDCGWTIDSMEAIYWPVGGGLQQTQVVTWNLMNGNWSFTLNGLTPGAAYNVVVQVTFANQGMMTSAVVSPDPATAMAAP